MKNKIYRLLFLLFLIAFGIFLYTLPVNSVDEGKNVFSSAYFKEYRQQLKSFIESHPSYKEESDSKRLVEIILEPLDSADQARLSHQRFVTELRAKAALQLIEQKKDPFLHDLILWIFTGADLREATEKYLYQYIPPPKENLLQSIQQALTVLQGDPRFQGLLLTGDEDDGYLNGNLPSKQFKVDETEVIRMGTPATLIPFYPRFWAKSTIYPEFLAFLRFQPSHLYINLMKREGLESPRTRAIELLEKEFPNLYVVTLDKNSPFYTQNETYQEQIENSQFKRLFLDHLLKEKGAYFWTAHLDKADWRKTLSEIYDQVKSTYFPDQESLSRKERQDLIELTYLEILNALVKKLHPTSMNITCRQGIDRGPSLMILWMISRGGFSNSQLEALLLAPPLLIHNRPSYPSKIERFISAAERIYSKKK